MPTRRVEWPQAWRVIPSRYPPVHLYERLTDDQDVWDALIALEQLTNPRIRDEIGDIALVPPEDRVTGTNAHWVMAAFTHLNPKGSRFSNGTYGVYYAAAALETAIAETVFHFENFARDSNDPARKEDMRVLLGDVAADLEDVAALPDPQRAAILNPASYQASQAYGRERRDAGALGIVFPSVRHPGGECIGAFKPRAVGRPIQERHLQYQWDGTRVRRYFDYRRELWADL